MKKFAWVVMAILLVAGLSSCNKEKQEAAMEKKAVAMEGVTVEDLAVDKCACGMSLAEHAIIDTVHYHGEIYGFCNEKCKAAFENDPEAVIAKINPVEGETPPPPPPAE